MNVCRVRSTVQIIMLNDQHSDRTTNNDEVTFQSKREATIDKMIQWIIVSHC
jgi:low affinity Fe/Cu permease